MAGPATAANITVNSLEQVLLGRDSSIRYLSRPTPSDRGSITSRTVPAVLVGRVCVINVLTQIVPVVILILVRGLIGPEVAFPSAHATKEDTYVVIRPNN